MQRGEVATVTVMVDDVRWNAGEKQKARGRMSKSTSASTSTSLRTSRPSTTALSGGWMAARCRAPARRLREASVAESARRTYHPL